MVTRRARKRTHPDGAPAAELPLFGSAAPPEEAVSVAPPQASSSLRQANAWFGLHLASLDYSANTVQSYTTSVELLARFLGDEYSLGKVTPRQLQAYLEWLAQPGAGRSRTPVKTLALRVTGLRTFFQTLFDAGIITANPAADLWAPVGEPPLPEVLSSDEEQRIRDLAWALYREGRRHDPRPLLLLMLTLDLGLRRGELESLSTTQVITSAPQVNIRIHYKERRHRYKNRTLTAPPQFREVYRDYLRQYPPAGSEVFTASRRTLHRVLERLGQRTNASVRVTPMVMRWTCALHWYEQFEPEAVRTRLGLSPIGWLDAERSLQGLMQARQ